MTENEEKVLTARLEQLYKSYNPGVPLQEIKEFEVAHSRSFENDTNYPYTQQFDLYLSTLIEQMHAVNFLARPDWPEQRIVQFTLMAVNLKTFYSAYDRMIKGAYEDAFMLMRPLYEAAIRVVWMSCNPDETYAAVSRNPDPKGKRFNFTSFVVDQLKLDWKKEYSLLSKFSHANSFAAVEALVRNANSSTAAPVTFMLQQDEKLCSSAMNLLVYLFYCYFEIVRKVFSVELKDEKEIKLWALAEELEIIIGKILRNHPNPSGRWSTLINDCDQLIELVLRADAGEAWKTAWADIRQ